MSTAAIFEHHDFQSHEFQSHEFQNHDFHGREFHSEDAEAPQQEFALEEQRPEQPSLWKSILQLRVLLPYLSKILPMLEGAGNVTTALATAAPRQDLTEVTRSFQDVSKGFLDLQTGHREIRGQVQEQTVQLKRIDDQLLRLRESTERNTMEHQELVEDLKSASKLVRNLSAVMIILMVGVTAMVVFMLMHWRHS